MYTIMSIPGIMTTLATNQNIHDESPNSKMRAKMSTNITNTNEDPELFKQISVHSQTKNKW